MGWQAAMRQTSVHTAAVQVGGGLGAVTLYPIQPFLGSMRETVPNDS